MGNVLAAIIYTVLFSGIAIIAKGLRAKGVKIGPLLAMSGYCIPIWIITFLFLPKSVVVHVSWEYGLLLSFWISAALAITVINVYLYKHQSLSELVAYGLAFGAMIGFTIDLMIFDVPVSIITICAGSLLLGGGLLLTSKTKKKKRKIRLVKVFGLLALHQLFTVLAISLYKQALLLQDSIFVHILLFQLGIHSLFFIVGGWMLVKEVRKGRIRHYQIFALSGFILVGTIFEAFTFQSFPVSIVVLLAVIPLAIFSIYDLKFGEIAYSKRTGVAFGLIIVGLFLLQML